MRLRVARKVWARGPTGNDRGVTWFRAWRRMAKARRLAWRTAEAHGVFDAVGKG